VKDFQLEDGQLSICWRKLLGLVRCQKNKNYISWCGKILHSQWGGLEGENIPSTFIYPKKELPGSSHQQPTKKIRIKALKISQAFSPLWHPCDHKQTSLVFGGKYIPFPFNYWLSITGKRDNSSKPNSQFSAAPGVRNLRKSNKSHTENSASNISNVARVGLVRCYYSSGIHSVIIPKKFPHSWPPPKKI